jgi:hypothetical protein
VRLDLDGAALGCARPGGVEHSQGLRGLLRRHGGRSSIADGPSKGLVIFVVPALLGRHALLARRRPEGPPTGLALISPALEIVDRTAACEDRLGLNVGT